MLFKNKKSALPFFVSSSNLVLINQTEWLACASTEKVVWIWYWYIGLNQCLHGTGCWNLVLLRQTEWPTHASDWIIMAKLYLHGTDCWNLVLLHQTEWPTRAPDWIIMAWLYLHGTDCWNQVLLHQTEWPTCASDWIIMARWTWIIMAMEQVESGTDTSDWMANSCLRLNGQLMPPQNRLSESGIDRSDGMANSCLHETGCLNVVLLHQTEWPTHASMRLSECVLIHRLNGQLMPPHNRLSESGIVTSDWMANSCLRLNDQLMPQTQWPTHASGLMANSCLWLNGQLMPPWGCLNVVLIHQMEWPTYASTKQAVWTC